MNLLIRAATYSPGTVVARHSHRRAMLAAVVEGSVELRARGQRVARSRGAVLSRAEEPHENRFGPTGARLVLIEHDLELEPLELEGKGVAPLARRLWAELGASDSAAPLARQGLAFELLAVAARDDKRVAANWLRRVEDFLGEHFLEALTLDEIAAIAGVHPAHLARTFRAKHGAPLASWLRRRRIEWAAQQVRSTATPLAQIAIEAGFCDQAHFARVFWRLTGARPSDLRRRP